MRLRAGIGLLLLGSTACAGLPSMARIDVDGRVIEVRQQGLGDRFTGGWSASPECGLAAQLDVAQFAAAPVTVRVIGPDEIELLAPGQLPVRLYRCR